MTPIEAAAEAISYRNATCPGDCCKVRRRETAAAAVRTFLAAVDPEDIARVLEECDYIASPKDEARAVLARLAQEVGG